MLLAPIMDSRVRGKLKSLPVGTGYAIWTGIGAIGVSTIGIVFLQESASLSRIACIALIVTGIMG